MGSSRIRASARIRASLRAVPLPLGLLVGALSDVATMVAALLTAGLLVVGLRVIVSFKRPQLKIKPWDETGLAHRSVGSITHYLADDIAHNINHGLVRVVLALKRRTGLTSSSAHGIAHTMSITLR